MKLSRKNIETRRAALLCPAGSHLAELTDFRQSARPSGNWVSLIYRIVDSELEIREQYLVRPARLDLESMGLDHLEMLLQAVEATLGIDEVDDLAAALDEMKGKPVQIEVSHKDDANGKARAHIVAWRRPQ